jgi:ribosomal protein S3
LLNKFLLEFFKIFKNVFLISGIKIDVRGKLSAGGNSKKRHYLIKLGGISFSKKKNKISFSQNIVPTVTGVLGIELVLVY